MTKRQIRLKEFIPNTEKVHIPSDSYLKKSPLLERNKVFFQRVDENGFTCSHLNTSENKKIVLLGDSFIENIFVDESKRINSVMEELFLNDNLEIKVINSGISGSTGLNLLNLALNKIVYVKPNVIIYSQPSCDFSALLYKNGYSNNSSFFANIIPAPKDESFLYETIYENSYQILNNITLLAKICEVYNIKLFISTCCSNSSKRQLKIMNDIIRYNQHLGYEVIDLDNIIPKTEEFFYDKQHLNEKGSNFVAKKYFDAIKSNIHAPENYVEFRKESLIQKNKEFSFNNSNNIRAKLSLICKLRNNSEKNIDIKLNFIYIKEKKEIKEETREFNLPSSSSLEISYRLKSLEFDIFKLIYITDEKFSLDCYICSILPLNN